MKVLFNIYVIMNNNVNFILRKIIYFLCKVFSVLYRDNVFVIFVFRFL